jgi:hypothetical protein
MSADAALPAAHGEERLCGLSRITLWSSLHSHGFALFACLTYAFTSELPVF